MKKQLSDHAKLAIENAFRVGGVDGVDYAYRVAFKYMEGYLARTEYGRMMMALADHIDGIDATGRITGKIKQND